MKENTDLETAVNLTFMEKEKITEFITKYMEMLREADYDFSACPYYILMQGPAFKDAFISIVAAASYMKIHCQELGLDEQAISALSFSSETLLSDIADAIEGTDVQLLMVELKNPTLLDRIVDKIKHIFKRG